MADQEADTPAGNPVAVPIPVAPVVLCVIAVKAVFTVSVGDEEAAPAVLVMMHPHVGIPSAEIIRD